MPRLKGPVPQVQAKEGLMPQLVKKRRSGWALLAVGALIASLLAVGSAPAGAAEIKSGDANTANAEVKPAYTACVGDALDDAGFTDLGTLEDAARNINCLAYYEITTGKTADTFDPNSNVTRSQMALFLYRAANAAGVDTTGGDGDADFGDIADLGEDRQNAIKALARNNILAGRSDTAFDPSGDITRAEMAVALVGLLRHANSQLFNADGSLKNVAELDYFADARAAIPRAVDSAISQAYELGITTGRDDATFGPTDGVPRRNMASFIMRTLAHTNLRPAGVSIQRDVGSDGPTNAIRISVRSEDLQPVSNVRVDAFWLPTARAGEAFDDDGACQRLVKSVSSGNTACQIDRTDRRTDGSGNRTLGSVDFSKGAVVWAWTGDVGDKVSSGTNLFRLDVEPSASSVKATDAAVSDSLPDGITESRFGSSVTVTVQLKGDNPAGFPATIDVGPPKNGSSYSVLLSYPNGTADRVTVKADDAGAASFNVVLADPDTRADNTAAEGTVSYTVSSIKNAGGVWAPDCDGRADAGCGDGDSAGSDDRSQDGDSDEDDVDIPDNPETANDDESRTARPDPFTGMVVFSDDDATATSISVSVERGYDLHPPAPRGSIDQLVTVTVRDQYGNGISNQPVLIRAANAQGESAEDENADFETEAQVTGSTGEADFVYTYSGVQAGTQMFHAIVLGTDDADTENVDEALTMPALTSDSDPSTADVDDPVSFRWVGEGLEDNTAIAAVEDGDLENNEVVVTVDSTPTLVIFDSNDQFQTTVPDGEGGTETVYGMEAFVKALGGDLSINPKAPAATGTVTLTWQAYDPADPITVTGWAAIVTASN